MQSFVEYLLELPFHLNTLQSLHKSRVNKKQFWYNILIGYFIDVYIELWSHSF